MVDADSSPTTDERRPPAIDLGMICTCGPQRARAAEAAMGDVVARYHLDRMRLVSDLIEVLQRRFWVRDIRIGLDQWFGIAFRLAATTPPARGIVAADELEHGLVALLRHLDGTAPVPPGPVQ